MTRPTVLMVPQARTGDWRTEVAVDELYFDALLKRVTNNLCVDTRRIFSMGFSGGGSYSGVLGCTRTDIRAIAVGGAVIYFDPTACVGTPAAWVTIGDDELIPARAEYRDFWRTRNQCTAETSPVDPDPCVAYACPIAERPVHYCRHVGGHEWPTFGSHAAWGFLQKL